MTAYAPALIQPNLVPFIAVGGFSPSDVSNMIAWFDSSVGITLNGSDVSGWDDQSAEGNDLAQATAADQPLYNSSNANFNNEPSLTFDGTSEHMITGAFAGGAISQPNTIFIVYEYISKVSVPLLFDGIASGNRHSYFINSNAWQMYGGATVAGSTDDTNIHISGFQFNTTTSNAYLDGGTADISGNTGTNTLTGLTLAARFSIEQYSNVDVAELIIYDKLVGTTEFNQIGNYLATKFGTSWSDIS